MQNTFHIAFTISEPPKDLKDVVKSFWTVNTDQATFEPFTFRVMADGCPGIIIQHFDKRLTSPHPPCFIYGQATSYDNLYCSGDVSLTGVVFQPGAINILFGFDADEITNETTNLNLVWPEITGRINFMTPSADQLSEFSSMIRIQKERSRGTDCAIQYCINLIHKSDGMITIPELYKSLQLSERQFERRFKRFTGVSPKLFSRIIRFQSSLRQLRSGNYQKLSDVAFDRGYSDQAHFIREFKQFSGLVPGRYHSPKQQVVEICRI
ncbi:MAG: helix-turn-helix transcriptional regulator [Balneolaceae bacterium]|nr:helix-turn-helix transcriptional regulator [Balneolaceae bacterium]